MIEAKFILGIPDIVAVLEKTVNAKVRSNMT